MTAKELFDHAADAMKGVGPEATTMLVVVRVLPGAEPAETKEVERVVVEGNELVLVAR